MPIPTSDYGFCGGSRSLGAIVDTTLLELSTRHSLGRLSQTKPVALGVLARPLDHDPEVGPSAIVRGLPWAELYPAR